MFFQFFFQMVWKISVEVFCLALIFGPIISFRGLEKILGVYVGATIIVVTICIGSLLFCITAESMNKTWRLRHRRSYLDFML